MFVKVPLRWVKAASEATLSGSALAVLILLAHMAWEARSSTFTCPNGLMERHGITREAKRRALVKLEAAGLIAVQRQARHSPVVTLKL